MYVDGSNQPDSGQASDGGLGDIGFLNKFFSTVTSGVTSPAGALTGQQPVASGGFFDKLQNAGDNFLKSAIQFRQIKSVLKSPASAAFWPVNQGAAMPAMEDILAAVEVPLSKAEIRNLQQSLANMGINPGPIDGLYGPKTARAIAGFQSQNRLAADGQLSRALYNAVLGTATRALPSEISIQPIDSRAPSAAPIMRDTGERLIPGTRELVGVETPLSPTQIRQLQTALARLGIDPGPIDGLYGPRTAGGIQQFQSRNFLPVDGKLSNALYFMVTAAAASAPRVNTPQVSYPPRPAPTFPAPAAPAAPAMAIAGLPTWAIPAGLAAIGGAVILMRRK